MASYSEESDNSIKSVVRLASFKTPRDLTLNATSLNNVTKGGISKRKFVPTIPIPKQNKETEEIIKTIDKQTVKNKENVTQQQNFRNKNKKNNDLVQLKSIFDEGPMKNDLNKAKQKTGIGGYRESNSNTSAKSHESSFTKSYFKKEQDEDDKSIIDKILKDDFIDDDDDFSISGNNLPVILPFSDKIKKEIKSEGIQNLKIKKEKELDHRSETSIDLYENNISSLKDSHYLNEEELFLIQLPDCLPGYPANQFQSMNPSADNEAKDGPYLKEFTEGFIGKLLVHKSGKMQLILGKISLDGFNSIPSEFLQEAVITKSDTQPKEMILLGPVKNKITFVPNVESLIDSIS